MILINSLKQRSEFLNAAKAGQKWVSKGLVLQAVPNKTEQTRFGLTITKKVYKEAVKRNRIRRRMRALALAILPEHATPGYDFVLIGREETLDRAYEDLQKDLKWCLKKLELLKE